MDPPFEIPTGNIVPPVPSVNLNLNPEIPSIPNISIPPKIPEPILNQPIIENSSSPKISSTSIPWYRNFTVWFIILVLIIFVLWYMYGTTQHEFQGISYKEICGQQKPECKELNDCKETKDNVNIKCNNKVNMDEKNLYDIKDNVKSDISDGKVKIKKKGRMNLNADSRGETICRQVLEKIYGKPFPKMRPDWLINPETGCNLELDCCNMDLKIAAEYNGIQHYKFPNFYHRTKEEFIEQVRRDSLKLRACEASGVYLIRVPYSVPHNDIQDYIIARLPENIAKLQVTTPSPKPDIVV
jgi:hypothetical protein